MADRIGDITSPTPVLGGVSGMSLISRVLAAQMGMPPAHTRDVAAERGLRVPMRDGTVLLADRYFPRRDERAALVLIRCPYGRGSGSGLGGVARVIAERGYQVLLQSTRGTFDSGGRFEPGVTEPGDGLATVQWLRRQPWYPGSFVTYGASYLGYVQWALAMAELPDWRAAAIGVAPSSWHAGWTHRDGIFSLGNALYWLHGIEPATTGEASQLGLVKTMLRPRRLRDAERHLPVGGADQVLLGRPVDYYQQWVAGDGYPPLVDFRAGAANLPPVHLAAGWFDFFLPTMLTDYVTLRRAGRPVRMCVGPGRHEAFYAHGVARDAFAWLDHHGRGRGEAPPETPVRVYVLGADRWLDLADWPPPDATPTRWYLTEGGGLTRQPGQGTSSYRYDPADPTPNVGGAYPDVPYRYGRKDNRKLEARADVLTFTTDLLDRDAEIVGAVSADLCVRSSRAHTDFFVKLCDVARSGGSTNVCDGIVRLRPGDEYPQDDRGVRRVEVDLAGIAYRFLRGHRIRLQVSSGAHPRYTRNLGTGDAAPTATAYCQADQEIRHDTEYRSAVTLPLRM